MSSLNARGYILLNQLAHSRRLPISSTHAFRYHTFSFLLELDALESGRLDLALGLVFSYGGRWGRLLGLRSQPYLDPLSSSSSIRQKLEDQFHKHLLLCSNEKLEDAWIMTMPSILGFEGINPLTVYFCYKKQTLWTVVLEIHNTFGESHIHFLKVGSREDSAVLRGYDHQWTFRRRFHVSPFNDRSGFYTVSVKSPGHPLKLRVPDQDTEGQTPLPAICVRLYADPDSTSSVEPGPSSLMPVQERPSIGKLKLVANIQTTFALPLTTRNVIKQVLKQPLMLFLTMPRILYHAGILHFLKRLDIFPRPEPYLVTTSILSPDAVPGGGVGWQEEGMLEAYTHELVLRFLHRRTAETGISVILTPSNSSTSPTKILAVSDSTDTSTLEISYLSPRFFVTLFMCPSSVHSLLPGCETSEIFRVSSRDLFLTVFSCTSYKASSFQRMLQSIRRTRISDSSNMTSPTVHFLDTNCSMASLAMSTVVFSLIVFFDFLEKVIFQATGVRFVKGTEPWNSWERAMDLDASREDGKIVYGSVGRE